MSTTIDEAPQGLEFSAEAGDALVVPAQAPTDKFDPRFKDDIDGLVWLGFLTDTFTMYGHTFTIQTLTRGERMAVTQVAKPYEDTLGAGMALGTATVAACILMVNGMPLNPAFTHDEAPLSRINANFEIVSKWFDPLIEAIYAKFTELQMRQIDAFYELESK